MPSFGKKSKENKIPKNSEFLGTQKISTSTIRRWPGHAHPQSDICVGGLPRFAVDRRLPRAIRMDERGAMNSAPRWPSTRSCATIRITRKTSRRARVLYRTGWCLSAPACWGITPSERLLPGQPAPRPPSWPRPPKHWCCLFDCVCVCVLNGFWYLPLKLLVLLQ